MKRKNILIICASLILLFVLSRLNATSGAIAFGLIALAQVVLIFSFIVGTFRLAGATSANLKINDRENRILIWGGTAALIASPVWFVVAAAVFFSINPSALGLTPTGDMFVVFLPTLFLAGTGLSMVGYGLILRYIASHPDM